MTALQFTTIPFLVPLKKPQIIVAMGDKVAKGQIAKHTCLQQPMFFIPLSLFIYHQEIVLLSLEYFVRSIIGLSWFE